MANNNINEKEQVDIHIHKLSKNTAAIVQKIREIILKTDPSISEYIKWNNPSFYYNGEMKAFDPKEYKRDIAVMNLHKNRIMLVFPSGAKVNDNSGFLEGNYRAANRKDGRRTVIFKDLEDVELKKEALQIVLKKWLELVEK